jgi:hypothetical protein
VYRAPADFWLGIIWVLASFFPLDYLRHNIARSALALREVMTVSRHRSNSMEKYNEVKSEEILQNLKRVNDEDGVLQQAFDKSPYNLNVYYEAIKRGKIDKDLLDLNKLINY